MCTIHTDLGACIGSGRRAGEVWRRELLDATYLVQDLLLLHSQPLPAVWQPLSHRVQQSLDRETERDRDRERQRQREMGCVCS